MACFSTRFEDQLPIIEADFGFEWPYRVLNLIIRNRLPETIVVTSAKIKRPKGSLISKPEWSSKGGIEIKQPTSNRIDLDFDVAPFGAATVGMPGAPMYADTQRCDLYLLFPTEWTSGIVAIDLSISSRALTLRDKRMVIKRFTTAPPARKIATSANIPSTHMTRAFLTNSPSHSLSAYDLPSFISLCIFGGMRTIRSMLRQWKSLRASWLICHRNKQIQLPWQERMPLCWRVSLSINGLKLARR